MCYCSNMGAEQTLKQESAKKVNSGGIFFIPLLQPGAKQSDVPESGAVPLLHPVSTMPTTCHAAHSSDS